MKDLKKYLTGGDLRSIGDAHKLVSLIHNQNDFDKLFTFLLTGTRLEVMRAADAIEKITVNNHAYLYKHKNDLLNLFYAAQHKEFKWHLTLLISRIKFSPKELQKVIPKLIEWIKDTKESKIVRVNSLQSLYELTYKNIELKKEYEKVVKEIEKENIASINARIKKLNSLKSYL